MKQLVGFLALSLAAIAARADIAFEVKDVEAHPRYPWNGKVDIDFTIDSAAEGSNFAVRVSAVDTIGQTNVTLKTVRYDDKDEFSILDKLPAGRHRVTWDADADVPGVLFPSLAFSVSVWQGDDELPDPKLYMVIDLSRDAVSGKFRVSYLPSVPEGGWSDEYKTTKLVLRRIPGEMFYAGIFEVTKRQFMMVAGGALSSDSYAKGKETEPFLTRIETHNVITPYLVDYGFTSKLKTRGVRLPTQEEWRYVCYAGEVPRSMAALPPSDKRFLWRMEAGWVKQNSGGNLHPVGLKLPNSWGIYDMYGNVDEYVRLEGRNPSGYIGGSYCTSVTEIPSSLTAVDSLSDFERKALGFRVFCDAKQKPSRYVGTEECGGVDSIEITPPRSLFSSVEGSLCMCDCETHRNMFYRVIKGTGTSDDRGKRGMDGRKTM